MNLMGPDPKLFIGKRFIGKVGSCIRCCRHSVKKRNHNNKGINLSHLYLIDGSGYIFRAFYGLPAMTRSDGTPVNAVFGFCTMLFGLLEGNNADYLAVIFDAKRANFRNEIYPDYKANRADAPEDLRPQFPLIRKAVESFSVPAIELEGYEADDLIAAYAKSGVEAGMKVTVMSSDKDLMQLVRPGVSLFDPVKNKPIGPTEVEAKFGVAPDRVVDVQALAGDSTDNVPGVPGIGVKTAAELIRTYGDLETLLARAGEIKQPKRRQLLLDHAEDARISRRLVLLDEMAPQPAPLEDLKRKKLDRDLLRGFLVEQEFSRLLNRLAGDAPGRDQRMRANQKPAEQAAESSSAESSPVDKKPESAQAELKASLSEIPFGPYELVSEEAQLHQWIEKIRQQGYCAFDTETTGLDIMRDQLVGISLACAPGEACYIPLGHGVKPPRTEPEDNSAPDMFAALEASDQAEDKLPGQLPKSFVLSALKPLLEDPSVLKIAQNWKFDFSIMANVGIRPVALDDTMLLSFCQAAGLGNHGMDELSLRHLGHRPIKFEEVVGKGAKRILFSDVPLEQACDYAAEDADVTLRLWLILKPALRSAGLSHFYETIERPLIPVISQMECDGVRIDQARLSELKDNFTKRMTVLEAEIHALAGENFNIASPKQISDILFGKLGLPSSGKKTGGGAISTSVSVLEPLARDYPIARLILEWRMLAKLISTYCEALITAADPLTKRVHTSFSMTGAQTGRLSSVDPNLQNIPIRTEEGRQIREAFVASPGHKLISLDYSQIELRLLAEIAGIEKLREAFKAGQDIHAVTASDVFAIPLADIDAEYRRRAKAINFGIVYGISAYGLARQLNISNQEAKQFIDRYFQRYPGIRGYMSRTIESCHATGYVETLFGRRIYIPMIRDANKGRVQGAERQAINAPIQGSAADVIKRAMIRIPGALSEAGLDRVKMLLQVHDELIFEVPEADIEAAVPVITTVMETATLPLKTMKTPLKVDCGVADNWAQAH